MNSETGQLQAPQGYSYIQKITEMYSNKTKKNADKDDKSDQEEMAMADSGMDQRLKFINEAD